MAEVKIYIHGVPIGQDIWGPNEDQDYIQLFYNHDESVKEKSYMQIEVLRNKTFYSYLRKHNVINSGGRSGSYFGITVSFNSSYCTNVSLLYQIFEVIYNNKCLNIILKDKGDFEQYLVQHFSDIQSDIEQISKLIIQHIDKYLSNNIVPFTDEIKYTQAGFVRFNTIDVDSPTFVETFKKCKVRVSPEYPSKKDEIIALTAKVSPLQAKCEKLQEELTQSRQENQILGNDKQTINIELNQIQTELISLKQTLVKKEQEIEKKYLQKISSLEKQFEQQKTIAEILTTENSELKKALEKAEIDKDLKIVVKSIKEPLFRLARLMASRFPEDFAGSSETNTETIPNHTKATQKYMMIGCLISNILLVLYILLTLFKPVEDISVKEGQIIIEKAEYNKLNDRIKELETSVSMPQNTTEPVSEKTLKEQYPNCSINIQGYKGPGKLKIKKYILNIKHGPSGGYIEILPTNAAEINGMEIKIIKDTALTINYKVGDEIIAIRKIE